MRHRRRVCKQEDTPPSNPKARNGHTCTASNKRRRSDHLLKMNSSKEAMNVADRLEAAELASDNQKGEDEDMVKQCASCGKSSNALKKCTACKSAWYCNVSCQKAHRKAHKKGCKRIEKDLRGEQMKKGGERKANGKMEEEKFGLWNPKPREVCPICMCLLPIQRILTWYASCCGKQICGACIHAQGRAVIKINAEKSDGAQQMDFLCPFCRMPPPGENDHEEIIGRLQSRIEIKDGFAMQELAVHYKKGEHGLPVDEAKCLDLLHRAADHGSAEACDHLSTHYLFPPPGVPQDCQKSLMYLKRGATAGGLACRFNLGMVAWNNMGDKSLAARHWRISAAGGDKDSVDMLTKCFQAGIISKKDLEDSIRAKHEATKEMWSEERDKFIQFLKERGEYDEVLYDYVPSVHS